MDAILAFLRELAPISAVVAFAGGVYQFHRSIELSFRKPYWERLLSLYVEACSSAATLATSDSEADWSLARNSFCKLYHDPLCLVEDRRVEEAMVLFGDALKGETFQDRNEHRLSGLSLKLAYACRNSIRADWRVPLEDLPGRKH